MGRIVQLRKKMGVTEETGPLATNCCTHSIFLEQTAAQTFQVFHYTPLFLAQSNEQEFFNLLFLLKVISFPILSHNTKKL
jgi:hypothetical protein